MSLLEVANKWLPPPTSLRLPAIGIDIAESSVKYIGFKPNTANAFGFSLEHYGEVSIADGAMSSGEVNNVSALAAAFSKVKSATGISYARISLPEERVYLFETEIDTNLRWKQIRDQIEFRLEENVPLSPRDAYFDFQIVEKGDDETVAIVTVCAKEIVDKYYEACRLAKITPLAFEVESAAIARAVLPKKDPNTKLLLDFGKTRTGIGIVHQGILMYTSTIDIGGDHMSAALRRQFGEKPESDLTKIKNSRGLIGSTSGDNPAEVLLPIVSALKDEVQARIEYWDNKSGVDRSIDGVVIGGGSANLRGITTYLTETLGIETVLADVWQNVFDSKESVAPISRPYSYGYVTAVGLALASFVDDI